MDHAGAGDATSQIHANTTRYVARRYRDGSCHARRTGIGEGLAAGDGAEFRRPFRRVRLPYPHFRRFAGRVYTPEQASPEEMTALHRSLRIERVVIVTPSVYGTDNSATLCGMKSAAAPLPAASRSSMTRHRRASSMGP